MATVPTTKTASLLPPRDMKSMVAEALQHVIAKKNADQFLERATQEIQQTLKVARERYKLYFEDYDHRFRLAYLGDIEGLRALRVNFGEKQGNTNGPRGMNIVMIAAIGGSVATLQYLFSNFRFDYDIYITDHVNPNQRWGLLEAIAVGSHIPVLRYLLSVNKDLLLKLLKNNRFATISQAIQYSSEDFVAHLISVDPSFIYETSPKVIGKTTLMRAAEKGNEKIFDLILKCDQNEQLRSRLFPKSLPQRVPLILATDAQKSTVLHYAVNGKNVQIVTKILNIAPQLLYATTITENRTALINAALQGQEACVALLLQKDAVLQQNSILKQKLLTITTSDKINVCMAAAINGHVNVLRAIKNIDPKTFGELLFSQSEEGHNVIHYAAKHSIEATRFLIEECDPDGRLLQSSTARNSNVLQLAASESFEIYQYLIEKNPALLIKPGKDGMSTLMYAVIFFFNIKEVTKRTEFTTNMTMQFQPEKDPKARIRVVTDILKREPGMIYLKDSDSKTVFDHLQESQVFLSQILTSENTGYPQYDGPVEFEPMAHLKALQETFVKLKKMLYNHFIHLTAATPPKAALMVKSVSAHPGPFQIGQAEQLLAIEQQIEHQKAVLASKDKSIQLNERRLLIQKGNADLLRKRLADLKSENKRLKEGVKAPTTTFS